MSKVQRGSTQRGSGSVPEHPLDVFQNDQALQSQYNQHSHRRPEMREESTHDSLKTVGRPVIVYSIYIFSFRRLARGVYAIYKCHSLRYPAGS